MTLEEAKRYDAHGQAHTSYVDRWFEERLRDCRKRGAAARLRASRLVGGGE